VLALDCRELWQITFDARFSGGSRLTGAVSIAECLQLCTAATDCLAADYNSVSVECRLHTSRADLTQTVTAPGYRQYLLVRRCDVGQ